MRAIVAAVLLGLSGCAATITVAFPGSTRWEFTANRLLGLIGIIAISALATWIGFKLVRRYLPDKHMNSN